MAMTKKQHLLVETAKALFFKFGIHRVSVKEICNEAQVSKMTFYSYFKNKEELVMLIRDQLLEEGFSKFDEINKLNISYMEKVELMTAWRIGFTQSMDNEFVRNVMEVGEIEERIKTRYLENIIIAQQKNEIDPSLNPELIWLVTEKFNDIVKEMNWQGMVNDIADLQKQLRKMYFYGLINQK